MIYHDIVYPCTREWLDFTRITLHVEGVFGNWNSDSLPQPSRKVAIKCLPIVSWAVFFCCLGPSTPVLPTPLSTQCLRGHSGSLRGSSPLKVCLRRPNARIKRRHNVCFCLRRHTSVCFWKVGNGTFAYATTVPFTFLQHERPGFQSAHRHLAATPMCSSRTSNQVPKRTLNIWWINHDKSLKTQL